MLTIKPPIRLRCQRTIDAIHRDLEEKIHGNYALMQDSVRREELLHLTASSPEIYFEEGGTTNILNEVTSHSRQEFRLDVINNLMNRILLSNTQNFSYQDSVYVSSVLRKLGITDVNRFMKQVMKLQKERKENNRLIELYEENKTLLAQLFLEEKGGKPKTEENYTEEIHRNDYYLHDEIYKRLTTGSIYEDVRNFWLNSASSLTQISPVEMSVAEQSTLAQTFRLQSLKNEILKEEFPLTYYHVNAYEIPEEDEEGQADVPAQVTSAVLLNLADQIYSIRQNHLEKNVHSWYLVAGALFETAQNTWKRYEAYHREAVHISNETRETLEELNLAKREEIEMLTGISNQYSQISSRWEQNTTRHSQSEEHRLTFVTDTETQNTVSNYYQNANPQLELDYLLSQAEPGEERPLDAETVEKIKEQLRITDEKNLENLKKIREIQSRQPKLADLKVNKERAKRDILRALDNPEEVLKEYLTTEYPSDVEEQRQKYEQEIYQLFPEDTKAVLNQYFEQQEKRENRILTHPEEESVAAEEPVAEMPPVLPEGSPVAYEIRSIVKQLRETAQLQRELQGRSDRGLVEAVKTEWEQAEGKGDREAKAASPKISQREAADITFPAKEAFGEEAEPEKKKANTPTAAELRILKELRKEEEPYRRGSASSEAMKKLAKEQKNKSEDAFVEMPKAERVLAEASNAAEEKQIPSEKKQQEAAQIEYLAKEIFRETVENEHETVSTHNVTQTQIVEALQRHGEKYPQREIFRNVSMIHREEEQTISEDVLNQIRQQTRETVRSETLAQRNLQEHRIVETNTQQTVNRITTQQLENVEELVQQNISRQLNKISDQVYGKIEKRLQTERKRRGI